MKTLTAQAEAARTRRWVRVDRLLELVVFRDQYGGSPTSTTIRVSDRAHPSLLGQEWLPLVQSWGTVVEQLSLVGPAGQTATCDIQLANRRAIATPGGLVAARFSDVIRHGANQGTGAYDLAFGEARLFLVFRAGAAGTGGEPTAGDEVKIFRLILEEAVDLTEESVTLRFSTPDLALESQDDLFRLDGEYSQTRIAREDLGRPVPVVIGSVRDLPILGYSVSAKDVLSVALAADPSDNVAIVLSDPGELQRFFPTNSFVTVEASSGFETIGYATVDAGPPPRLVTLTRTNPLAHGVGASVVGYQPQTWIVAENRGAHKTKSVTNLRRRDTGESITIDGINWTLRLSDLNVAEGRDFVTLTAVPLGQSYQLTCDVEGLQDDGSGTISGTPNLLLTNPADVTKLLMREIYGEKLDAWGASAYDDAGWATTRASQVAAGLAWAFRFDGMPFSEFRELAGLQGRADLYQEGGLWRYRYREETGAAQVTLDADRELVGRPAFGWTPRTAVVTRLRLLYDERGDTGGWRGHHLHEASLSAENSLGTRRGKRFPLPLALRFGWDREARPISDLPLPWVRSRTVAEALAVHWGGYWERQRLVVRLSLGWLGIILEQNDRLALSNAAVLTPYGGSSVIFRIREKRYDLDEDGQGTIALVAVELTAPTSQIGLFQPDIVQPDIAQP